VKNYSQSREQEIIFRELSSIQNGNFLDIGAHDGESLSNTRALALSGWSGTLVEPNPNLFLRLVGLYGQDPKITLINSAMSDKSGLVRFFYDGSHYQYSSSIAENVKELFPDTPFTATYLVNAISPKDVEGQKFDFVSIDTEGYDLPILVAVRGILDETTLVCIEYNYTDLKGLGAILEELKYQGFAEVDRTTENIMAKKVYE
jgi:FkbM family methyltransferase